MLSSFFHDGGWGMYPTGVFGFLLVASGVLLLLRPERRFVPLVLSLGVVTLGCGGLNCCVGIVNSFHYLGQVPPANQLHIAALGCAESLNNVVLALILVVLTSFIASLAALRAAWGVAPAGETR